MTGRAMTAPRAHVERGSTSSKGARNGRVWMVSLFRGDRKVILATQLSETAAQSVADDVNELLA